MIIDDCGYVFANFLLYIFFFASVGQDEWHRRLKEARLGFAFVSRRCDAMVRCRTS